ncbi:MAG: 4'-phosphopantetheinyl transferase superfamily protein [Desulfatirhabdiaceae bacterium]
MRRVYPVILPVPDADKPARGRERNTLLSRLARQAVHASAQKAGAAIQILEKADSGRPLPDNGLFWSLSHKPDYVAGVVDHHPIGIDLEKIRPVSDGMYRMIALPGEWDMGADCDRQTLFFRYWTAKEAVLKAFGIGLKELSRCHISAIMDDTRIGVHYREQNCVVQQICSDGYIFAVFAGDAIVEWFWM